jgi:acyl-CoA synthetase (AMP-forming)/AMP-acid ligase II
MALSAPIRPSIAPYEAMPLQELLRRAARRLPDKVAVIDGERRFTYRQLDQYSGRFAAAMKKLGVAQGDRVGILSPNCVEFEIAFYGAVKAGAVASTINSGYREREIAYQLNNAGVEVLVVHQALLQMAEAARDAAPGLRRLVVIADPPVSPLGKGGVKEGVPLGKGGTKGGSTESFWDLIERAPARPPSVALDPKEDLAVLPYSSGTTGLSKGVMLTHFNLTSNVRQFLYRGNESACIQESDVILVHLPLFHIYGMNVLMNCAIGAGATQVMMGRFDMELFLRLLSRHRVTQMYTVPPVGLGLTQYPGVRSYDLSSLRMGLFGAAPLPTELQKRIQDTMGFPIIQGYGLTETSPVTNADFMEPERARPGSVGPAMPDTEEKVVDLETGTKEVAPGEVGELLVRGPQVMKGYFNNPQATAETITEDGWLHTGDIVRMDPDGYVWILDRKKELIKYKGFQVPPAELEGLLLEHPAVADAAVIGKADVEAGEVPKAFVVRKRGASVSADDLMAFVAGKVASFKQVRDVEFVDAIPKNPSGKILRRVLIEQERAKGK